MSIKSCLSSRIFTTLSAVAISVGSLTLGGHALAADAADFYKGKSIKWIVPYKPGGGYDEYSRLIAPFMEKYTGARVDVANMPGSGGMKGAIEIFKSPADGLTVGIINGSAMVTNELAEIKGADYKVAEYNFIGRIVADTRVLVTSTENDLATIEDVFNSKDAVKIGATGLGGSTYVDSVIVGQVFGMNQKVIHGFNSSSDIRQAMLRKDVHAMWGSYGSARKGVKAGQHRVVLQGGSVRAEALPDVPTAMELAANLDDSAGAIEVLNAWQALSDVGRPVAAPPGVDADRVAFLRDAFAKVLADPEFLEIAAQSKRRIAYASGEDMVGISKAATTMSDDVRKLLVAAIRGEI